MIPGSELTDEEVGKRFEHFYEMSRTFSKDQIPYLRKKLSSLSEFIREIKVGY